jgi:TonB-like protein
MLRLWANSYSKKTPLATGATVSVVAHALLIGASVIATLPAADVPEDSIANRVFYIPPPDRVGGQRGSRETVRYVDITQPGPGTGDGPATMGNDRPLKLDRTVGKAAEDTTTSTAAPPLAGPPDSVFSILEVDSAVVRAANSAAPAYPLKLLRARITGAVAAQYIVDTTGFADSASFKVMNTANPEFEKAVRAALPYMRFQPAKIGTMKVRQLVEQMFTFRIADTATVVAPAKVKPSTF